MRKCPEPICCWACQTPVNNAGFLCGTCNTIQAPRTHNYFELLGFEKRFDIDNKKLEQTFKNLQRVLHPDKYQMKSQRELDLSESISSAVNTAYQTLKKSNLRAQYMLQMDGHSVQDTDVDMDFLEKVMNIMEAIDDHMLSQDQLKQLREECEEDMVEVEAELAKLFADKKLDEARRATAKLNYLHRICDDVANHLHVQ